MKNQGSIIFFGHNNEHQICEKTSFIDKNVLKVFYIIDNSLVRNNDYRLSLERFIRKIYKGIPI